MDLQTANHSYLTPNEEAALQGLSWPAQILYLRGIRRYVNYKTSIAGSHDIRLSWYRFSVVLEVIRPSRSKKKSQEDRPSRQFIRERLKELEKAGLIVTKPNPRTLRFSIFFLPLTTIGQIRISKEQPLFNGVGQPTAKKWLFSTEQYGVEESQQPIKVHHQQPIINDDKKYNVIDIIGHSDNKSVGLIQDKQPSNTKQHQPTTEEWLLSTNQCGVGHLQEPINTKEEQPYIYRIERIEEINARSDLTQQQKERIVLLFDRLVSDERLHSLNKHFSEFMSLAIEHEMSFDELRDILNKIKDDQFTIKLIKHQLINFVRKTKAKPQQVSTPQPKAKPKQIPTKPNNFEQINEISSELTTLQRLIRHAPDNQALIDQQTKLEAKLLELKQA